MKTYLRLLPFLKPYIWPYFLLAMICMLGFGATNGVVPFLVQRIMDDVFANKNAEVLAYLPWVIIIVFALRGLLHFGQSHLSDYVGLRIINDVRNLMHRHLQSLSVSFFHRHPTGTLVARLNSDVTLLRGALTDALSSFFRDATSLVVLVAVAFYKDWVLASIAFFAFPASVLPVIRLGKNIKRITRRGQITTGTLTALLQESIQGNRVVKAFGMEQYENQRFVAENRRLFKQSLRASRIKSIVAPAMELLAAFGIGGVVWYGGWSVIAGGRTQGDFMAFMAAMFLMYQPFRGLTKTFALVQTGIAGADRVFEILDERSEVPEKPDASEAGSFSGAVEFHNVDFRYDKTPVLSGINLRITAGEMVALVGVSGVGKSTLADLVGRFYDVTSGKVTLDGVDVRDLTLKSLRNQIGIVTQHTFLFNDTIFNNIAYGDPDRSMEDVIAAAKAAHAHDFISAMPNGYHSLIGEMGMQLSGGQRQRLAIARALLKNAPILILDEATSSLDAESERFVQEALERLMNTRTTLVIAHRLSTIRRADRIVVLAEGRIVEEGSHEDLLARRGEYSRLYMLQQLEEESAAGELTLH